jgi:hypothetical protein
MRFAIDTAERAVVQQPRLNRGGFPSLSLALSSRDEIPKSIDDRFKQVVSSREAIKKGVTCETFNTRKDLRQALAR